MIKLVPGLIILVTAALVIGGCTPVNQPPAVDVATNHPPVIASLTSEWQRVKRAMTTTIECIASDPDEDKLTYIWSADGGNISGEGSVVTWVAPNTFGTYTINVTITDGRGSQATESIDIVVACCPGK